MVYPHWQYMLSLEADLENLARYIELAPANYRTYSTELVRLLLAASSEIDVVAKALCKKINTARPRKNVDDYRLVITGQYPLFPPMQITIPRYGITLTPWVEWASGNNPAWWRSYNDVKHERDAFYQSANLDNTLNALAGLFALVLYLYQPELYQVKLDPWPRLFALEDGSLLDTVVVTRFTLPDFPWPVPR